MKTINKKRKQQANEKLFGLFAFHFLFLPAFFVVFFYFLDVFLCACACDDAIFTIYFSPSSYSYCFETRNLPVVVVSVQSTLLFFPLTDSYKVCALELLTCLSRYRFLLSLIYI